MSITSFQEALPMPEKDRVMLPLIDIKDGFKLVLAALPKDATVPPHKAPYNARVLLVQGRLEVLKGTEWHTLAPGQRIEFSPGENHAVKALEASYFVVTHLRGY